MLAMFDVGSMIGQPSVGSIIETARHCGLPPYATMFLVVAAAMVVVAVWYAWATRRTETLSDGGRPT
jgi:hypothetical protein